jgi:phosphoribosylformylglycinamidine synthase
MGVVDVETVKIDKMSDAMLSDFLKKNAIALKVEEARKVAALIGRNPTLTELYIFNNQWSEHSSYKSSRAILKQLPTNASHVILGPKEDSGIVELGWHKGERYGIVISHESHNHPSQVVPYEGAATGVGGDIRDVLCMGAKVFAIADNLRFGNPNGQHKNKVKYIANEVINGIAGYGNPVGIPNICGDIYFNESFDENCLVNVVCLGVIKEKNIIHSYAPKNAVGYDIILVGKATDNSGFGGAAFASLVLDEEERESNRGAVQVPDPFLKNIIIRASYAVFEEARKEKVELGYKDLGAGGLMCATSEMCAAAGYGAEVDLDKVNQGLPNLPPFVVACSETQERMCWISPKEFTKTILKICNDDFELGRMSPNAAAVVIGKVIKNKEYVLKHKGKKVCNASIEAITSGIKYEREKKKPKKDFKEPSLPEPKDLRKVALQVLKHPNVASKAACFKHYDTNVMGNTIIHAGEADAGLMAPLPDASFGVALKSDCNPRYNRIDPYWGAVAAVAESMRNVAAIGAVPTALTDCLNYGSPERPEAFWDFCEGVRGIADAASKLHYKGTTEPVPVISGNVSFYNESKTGKSVDPSPMVACVGVMKDYSKAITMRIKKENSPLYLVGDRKDELGGSIFYDIHGELGANVPKVDFHREKSMIHAVIDAIEQGLVTACHDISDGGLLVCVAEMILGDIAYGQIGAHIAVDFSRVPAWKTLFSESSGFVMEVAYGREKEFKELFGSYGLHVAHIGKTGGKSLRITQNKKNIADIPIPEMREAWTTGFVEAMK